MTYTEPCGQVRRNPALHETGRRLPKRRSLRRTPKPSGEPSTRWSGDSRLRRGQKAGGVRKLRWALTRRGKRGGIRVIYFLRPERGVIWMLTLYPKNVADNIAAHVLKQVREEIEDA